MRRMTTFIRRHLFTTLGVAIAISFHTSRGQEKADFLKKYDLFYFDNTGAFTKNGKVEEKGGDKFTPDILFSDGSILSSYSEAIDKLGKGKAPLSEIIYTSSSLNQNRLFFQGKVYESFQGSESALRDGKFIYYLKCMKLEYNKDRNGNCCTKTALYANDDKIDEADFLSDAEISIGISNFTPLFTKNGILYYTKMVGERGDYYAYDPIRKATVLFRPDLFRDIDNALLAILDNGDIVFSNSNGIFTNSLNSKMIDSKQMGNAFFVQGIAIGNNFYYRMRIDRENANAEYSFFKNNLLVTRINSDVYGKIIDADKQDCHFGNFIYTYLTAMYGINKEGTIVRLDKRTKGKKDQEGKGPFAESDIEYVVNNDVVDFSRHWTTDGNIGKGIKSLSFVYDKIGDVSSLVVAAPDKNGLSRNIYLVPYLGDGRIGTPIILVSNATLFGVAKKFSSK